MKIFIQWTTDPASDWIEIDSSEWRSLPKKLEPIGGEVIDNTPGWVYAINCQGCRFSGDHYAIMDMPNETTAVISWTDDIGDRPEDEFHGTIALFKDPAFDSDPRVMKVNTRQQFNVFANKKIFDLINTSPSSNRSLNIFDNLIIPGQAKKLFELKGTLLQALYANSDLIRHGINVSEELSNEHRSIQKDHGWREWIK